MSSGRRSHDDREGSEASGQQHLLVGGGDGSAGSASTYALDPTAMAAAAAYQHHPPPQHHHHPHQQHPSAEPMPPGMHRPPHPYSMTDPSHHLPMEPPVATQPVLGYGMGYVPSQSANDPATMYDYVGQVPMQPMMQPGDPTAQVLGVGQETLPPQPHIKTTKRKQVKNACVNCQKACKKCDDGRPCQRCIKYNLTDTCINSPRKERKKGVKRGPYKRRQKQDTIGGLVHPSDSGMAAEEAAFSGSMVTGIPGMGVAASNVPPQEIPYYAYYPTQQPVLYTADPSQMQHGQTSGYYYVAAPQPPPQQTVQAPGGSAEHAGISLPQQSSQHPGYYYPPYYQAPPMAQAPSSSANFPSGSMAAAAAAAAAAATMAHPQSMAPMSGGMPPGGSQPSGQTPQPQQQQPTPQPQPPQSQQQQQQQTGEGSSRPYSFPGNLQHTAAVMIAPAMPFIPALTGQRRDSKLDILSELCTAVLDRDKRRSDEESDGDDDADDKLRAKKLGALTSAAYGRRLASHRTTPPLSPTLDWYKRGHDDERSARSKPGSSEPQPRLRRRFSTDSLSSVASAPPGPRDAHARQAPPHVGRLNIRLPPLGLSALGIITPENSPTEVSFPVATNVNDVLRSTNAPSPRASPIRDEEHDSDHANRVRLEKGKSAGWHDDAAAASYGRKGVLNPLPPNWPSMLPGLDDPSVYRKSASLVDALLPPRKLSLPILPSATFGSLPSPSGRMDDAKHGGKRRHSDQLPGLALLAETSGWHARRVDHCPPRARDAHKAPASPDHSPSAGHGDAAVHRSLEAMVRPITPLPPPSQPGLAASWLACNLESAARQLPIIDASSATAASELSEAGYDLSASIADATEDDAKTMTASEPGFSDTLSLNAGHPVDSTDIRQHGPAAVTASSMPASPCVAAHTDERPRCGTAPLQSMDRKQTDDGNVDVV
ncbi:hypothetical protein THASP1DRAFT_27305 [Thamnocephalis sphaerospora]|uniref:Zn(2)-C6 fungal-type domain-containing protein n=1 Tax=Thamnocephalis sphaerospora TaxID=78915 RepID=A0A4P9XZN0_9FUNG|nr:hypothetical protein THASP1DRAFT_27305 [Thamnocephalis sphaerospora]|eukprot:RKP10940.1 hypothetical protein THASP1DRAFT_27305 [Thamnocephalis sphaerospora]